MEKTPHDLLANSIPLFFLQSIQVDVQHVSVGKKLGIKQWRKMEAEGH